MENCIKLICWLCFLSCGVTSFPAYSSKSQSYSDVNTLCNSFAIRRLLEGKSHSELKDFILRMRNDKDFNSYDDDLSAALTNKYYGLENSNIDDKGIQDIADKIENLRAACVTLYSSSGESSAMKMKKDTESLDLIASDNFTDGGLKELLSRNSLNEPLKRGSDLGLNPTGWRKRRSGRNRDDESMEELLQNMRQILKKRERLQFNPTGW